MCFFRPRRKPSLLMEAEKNRTMMRSTMIAAAITKHTVIGHIPQPPETYREARLPKTPSPPWDPPSAPSTRRLLRDDTFICVGPPDGPAAISGTPCVKKNRFHPYRCSRGVFTGARTIASGFSECQGKLHEPNCLLCQRKNRVLEAIPPDIGVRDQVPSLGVVPGRDLDGPSGLQ